MLVLFSLMTHGPNHLYHDYILANISYVEHAGKDFTLSQWFLTWVRWNPRDSLSQSQGFGRGQEKQQQKSH